LEQCPEEERRRASGHAAERPERDFGLGLLDEQRVGVGGELGQFRPDFPRPVHVEDAEQVERKRGHGPILFSDRS
jgi:hypothetical protein